MTRLSRREAIMRCGLAAVLVQLESVVGFAETPAQRVRVISDNDYSGDPDGLFQLAHHALSRSVALRLIIGSHIHPNEFWDRSKNQASTGADKARELMRLIGQDGAHRILAGSATGIASRREWSPSPATSAIVQEAMRTDASTPLYYAAGAGLTEIALAWLSERRIGSRLKLVWIGGNEHPGSAFPPPGPRTAEYNLTIDIVAARIIFNESDIEIWQVPRDAYRRMLFSLTELGELAGTGILGRYLKSQIDRVIAMIDAAPPEYRRPLGETYVLGDSPLVTLTALQSPFDPDPSSSSYRLLSTPMLDANGNYQQEQGRRPMRVYTSIDAAMTFTDMVSKIKAWDLSRR